MLWMDFNYLKVCFFKIFIKNENYSLLFFIGNFIFSKRTIPFVFRILDDHLWLIQHLNSIYFHSIIIIRIYKVGTGRFSNNFFFFHLFFYFKDVWQWWWWFFTIHKSNINFLFFVRKLKNEHFCVSVCFWMNALKSTVCFFFFTFSKSFDQFHIQAYQSSVRSGIFKKKNLAEQVTAFFQMNNLCSRRKETFNFDLNIQYKCLTSALILSLVLAMYCNRFFLLLLFFKFFLKRKQKKKK